MSYHHHLSEVLQEDVVLQEYVTLGDTLDISDPEVTEAEFDEDDTDLSA